MPSPPVSPSASSPRLPLSPLATSLSWREAGPPTVASLRPLRITVPRIDVRFYRRSRNSVGVTQQPAHFRYTVQCNWGGEPQPRTAGTCWWDALPESYRLKRKWVDIQRFHEALVSELTWDARIGFTRIKGKVPTLPQRPDLDKFICGVAARGEASILNPLGKDGCDELELLHTVYVERQLKPYFSEVSKILAELPVEILLASAAFRKFVTSGSSCRLKDMSALGPARDRFCGPSPLKVSDDDIVAAAEKLRLSPKSPAMQRAASTGAIPSSPVRSLAATR